MAGQDGSSNLSAAVLNLFISAKQNVKIHVAFGVITLASGVPSFLSGATKEGLSGVSASSSKFTVTFQTAFTQKPALFASFQHAVSGDQTPKPIDIQWLYDNLDLTQASFILLDQAGNKITSTSTLNNLRIHVLAIGVMA